MNRHASTSLIAAGCAALLAAAGLALAGCSSGLSPSGVSVTIRIRTWMAKGVGPVKSQVTTNGTTVSGEGLKSFTRG
ncbi:MAG TPA: hypothetical protein VLL69_11850 [Streptosporangiaceae bacterium]|nr:hypothetical protein [Streptosporangiaceae bacterium]